MRGPEERPISPQRRTGAGARRSGPSLRDFERDCRRSRLRSPRLRIHSPRATRRRAQIDEAVAREFGLPRVLPDARLEMRPAAACSSATSRSHGICRGRPSGIGEEGWRCRAASRARSTLVALFHEARVRHGGAGAQAARRPARCAPEDEAHEEARQLHDRERPVYDPSAPRHGDASGGPRRQGRPRRPRGRARRRSPRRSSARRPATSATAPLPTHSPHPRPASTTDGHVRQPFPAIAPPPVGVHQGSNPFSRSS
jgi:hypothetical protein